MLIPVKSPSDEGRVIPEVLLLVIKLVVLILNVKSPS